MLTLFRNPQSLNALPRKVYFVIIFFLAVQAFQALRQPDLGSAFLGEYGQSESFLVQAGFIIFFLASFAFLDANSSFPKLRKILTIAVYVLFFFGIYQYYFKDPFTEKIITRISSLMGDPNSLGFFLLLALPLVLDEYLMAGTWSYVALGGFLVGVITLFLTYSRASWLAFLVSCFLIILTWIRQKPKKILIFALTIILALFLGQILTKLQPYSHTDYNLPARLNSVAQGNDSGRGLLWSTAWQSFQTKPFLGRGLGSFQDAFHLFQSKEAVNHWGLQRDLRQVHNEFFHYLATQGLLGLGAYLALILTILITAKPWRSHHANQNTKTLLSGTIISYLIAMQFAYPLLHYSFLFWIYLGLLLRLELPSEPKAYTSLNPITIPQKVLAALSLIIACLISTQIITADYFFRRASILSEQKHYYAAAVKYHLTTQLAPWNYHYHYWYGLTLIRCGRTQKNTEPQKSAQYFEKAKHVFLNLKKTNPNRYQIPFMLGKIAENQKEFANATQYYRQTLALFPNNYQIYFYLTRVEAMQDHWQAARTAFLQGMKLNPDYMKKMAKNARLDWRLL